MTLSGCVGSQRKPTPGQLGVEQGESSAERIERRLGPAGRWEVVITPVTPGAGVKIGGGEAEGPNGRSQIAKPDGASAGGGK